MLLLSFSRSRAGLFLALAGLVAVFSLRHHLNILRDTAYTLSAFYPLLAANPSLVYRYDPQQQPPPAVEPADQYSLPKIIHNIALGNGSISRYRDAMQSCRDLHPGWRFRLWTDADAADFVRLHYPQLFPHYVGYHQTIQRANLLRYAVLHHHGGVYMDLDVTCRTALDTDTTSYSSSSLTSLPFISPGAYPAGVNNAFLIARPGHAFLSRLLAAVPAYDLQWRLLWRLPYVENMLSTGCMFFTIAWLRYARDLVAGREHDGIYVLADEHGDLTPHMLRGAVQTPLLAHGGASSWHGWDAAAFVTIGKYYRLMALLSLAIAVAVLMLLLQCLSRRRRRHAKQDQGVLRKNVCHYVA